MRQDFALRVGSQMKLIAIVLTYNEVKHLQRCIESLYNIVDKIYVIDSYSTDETVSLARRLGATVLQNKWINHSNQFNWALTKIDIQTDWVLRIDADEYLTEELATDIRTKLPNLDKGISGVLVDRRMSFQGKLIKYGGVFPVKVLRLFRFGEGRCEDRWMDEHITVQGSVTRLNGELIDDNLNSLSWWISKHNRYSSLEAVEMLNNEFQFLLRKPNGESRSGTQFFIKRYIKNSIYSRIAPGIRSILYFLYRYIFCAGFLDGSRGASFHILQGLWYRYLVDAKVSEVKRFMLKNKVDAVLAIDKVLDVKVLD